MRGKHSYFFFLLLCISFVGFGRVAVLDSFPTPPSTDRLMFYIQRTPNINTVKYELNYKTGGDLVDKEPIVPYWIRYTEVGHPVAELSYVQKNLAYGVKSKKTGADEWQLTMQAYNKLPLTLKKDKNGKYKVFTFFDEKEVIFYKVFIHIDGGGALTPNVTDIDLYGRDVVTGKSLKKRIKIK